MVVKQKLITYRLFADCPHDQQQRLLKEAYRQAQEETWWADHILDEWLEKLVDTYGFANDKTRIHYGLSYSQGDGACFIGEISDQVKLLTQLLKENEITLADGMLDIIGWLKPINWEIHSLGFNYSHENSVEHRYCVESHETYQDGTWDAFQVLTYEVAEQFICDLEDPLTEWYRKTCRKIYSELQDADLARLDEAYLKAEIIDRQEYYSPADEVWTDDETD